MKNISVRWACAVILAAVLWSLDGVFLRPQLYSLSPELVVFLEHALGTLGFLYFLLVWKKQIQQLPRLHWGTLIRTALFGGILGTLFITKAFFLAIDGAVTFATVILFQKLQPLFALGMARVVLGEHLRRSFYRWALLALLAAYVLAFGFSFDAQHINRWHSGALFALFAAFAFGSSTVMSKDVVSNLDIKQSAGMRFLLVTIVMGIYLLLSGGMIDIATVSSSQWLTLVIIMCSSGAVALFIYYRWLQKIQASQATILELAWPLSAVFLDWIINGNILSITQFIAAGVMIVAMIQVGKKGKLVNHW